VKSSRGFTIWGWEINAWIPWLLGFESLRCCVGYDLRAGEVKWQLTIESMLVKEDVELLSIKLKSDKDLDNEVKYAQQSCKGTSSTIPATTANDSEKPKEDDLTDSEDHSESFVRLLKIPKTPNGSCGFHLTRTKWDPYPWVSGVDDFAPAKQCGLKAGDCVLEVNGFDVLGLRIAKIAKLAKTTEHYITLLLWSNNCNKCTDADAESLCAAPMPRSMQRLALIVQEILNIIECPVCRDTITPPAMQCQNGHLVCLACRIRAKNCPICRGFYTPRPALIAEQIFTTISSAFNFLRSENKMREKLFGRHIHQRQTIKETLSLHRTKHKSVKCDNTLTESNTLRCHHPTIKDKFLIELMQNRREYSTDSFSMSGNANTTLPSMETMPITTTTTTTAMSRRQSNGTSKQSKDLISLVALNTNQLHSFTTTTTTTNHTLNYDRQQSNNVEQYDKSKANNKFNINHDLSTPYAFWQADSICNSSPLLYVGCRRPRYDINADNKTYWNETIPNDIKAAHFTKNSSDNENNEFTLGDDSSGNASSFPDFSDDCNKRPKNSIKW
uniref:RING-type domain-containing protein n=1 Tax=Glossina pallidipes TaxID=7398 RepID=A0A1A9ZZR7_GLOPL